MALMTIKFVIVKVSKQEVITKRNYCKELRIIAPINFAFGIVVLVHQIKNRKHSM